MSKRWWLLGVGALVSVGLLLACGSEYNSANDGLFLVGTQGTGLIETFSFDLNSGHVSPIGNSPEDTANLVCSLNGVPYSLVMTPGGAYAYTIINQTPCSSNSANPPAYVIDAFGVNSGGYTTAIGTPIKLKPGPGSVPVVPYNLTMDSAGKFLFVANRTTLSGTSGSISVLKIGSGGALTEVAGSPFIPAPTTNTIPDIISVAATPTVLPPTLINGIQNAVCTSPGNTAPTTEFLYAVDTVGDQIFEFQVNTSSGVLTPMTGPGLLTPFATDAVPVGIAVDPCDRFVYVSDYQTNKMSAYTICNAIQQSTCPSGNGGANGSLLPVAGSPFSAGGSVTGLSQVVVDPYGNYVYVLGTSNTISIFKIAPTSGSLTAGTAPVATGLQPISITIRGDDTWMFVTNYNAATVSQYSITPETGVLTAEPSIPTDNYPYGVAVR